VPLLDTLPEDRLRTLWADSLPRRYKAGEVLRHAGDPAERLLLLLRGRVTATVSTPTGRVVRHGGWAGPCALDKVAVIDGRGHTATLTATTPCAVRSLSRARFEELLDTMPSVRTHVLRLLAGQARRHQARFAEAATQPVAGRLATWLLTRAAESPLSRAELPGTQRELADLLGTTRVTVNRILSGWRRDGLIEVTRTGVAVLAPELLALRTAAPARPARPGGRDFDFPTSTSGP
jgi:CRP/FNR family cyclic AMP-dependent transcriptional regulator